MLLGGKVAGNIDMTGNVHIEGKKLICGKGCIAKKSEQKKRNISQSLGLQTYLVKTFITF